VEFDGPAFLLPYHFSVLGCVVQERGITQIEVPERHRLYASRMHLWQSLGLEPPVRVNENDAKGRFHPLAPIVSEESARIIAEGVARVFEAAGTADEMTLNAISISLSEIFANCHFHAETDDRIKGLACAQSWPGAQRAQVAVADVGIGIRASLANNPAHTARLIGGNANELATELGVTSKPKGPHAGYGLAIARQLMEHHGGNLLVLSGSEAFRVYRAGWHLERRVLHPAWRGTIVILEWSTAVPLDIGAVYRGWPKVGESDDFV